jgi:hypothetical protein
LQFTVISRLIFKSIWLIMLNLWNYITFRTNRLSNCQKWGVWSSCFMRGHVFDRGLTWTSHICWSRMKVILMFIEGIIRHFVGSLLDEGYYWGWLTMVKLMKRATLAPIIQKKIIWTCLSKNVTTKFYSQIINSVKL